MTVVEEITEAWITYNSTDLMRWIGNNKERLKEKEKQQIIDTAIEFGNHGEEINKQRGEEYYNLIYKK